MNDAPRDTVVTHVSPALRRLTEWLGQQTETDRDRLSWSIDVSGAFVAGYEAGIRDAENQEGTP